MVKSEYLKNEMGFLGVIKFSCMTSKAKFLNEKQKQIVIYVDEAANKMQIREAVEKAFGIEVLKVRIINVKGKNKISGRRYRYTAKDRKKAIIILKNPSLVFNDLEGNRGDSGIDGKQILSMRSDDKENKENLVLKENFSNRE